MSEGHVGQPPCKESWFWAPTLLEQISQGHVLQILNISKGRGSAISVLVSDPLSHKILFPNIQINLAVYYCLCYPFIVYLWEE